MSFHYSEVDGEEGFAIDVRVSNTKGLAYVGEYIKFYVGKEHIREVRGYAVDELGRSCYVIKSHDSSEVDAFGMPGTRLIPFYAVTDIYKRDCDFCVNSSSPDEWCVNCENNPCLEDNFLHIESGEEI